MDWPARCCVCVLCAECHIHVASGCSHTEGQDRGVTSDTSAVGPSQPAPHHRQLSRQHPLLTTLIPQGAHRAAIVPRTTPLSRLQKAGSTAADDGANDDASSDNTNDTSLNFIVTYSVRKLSARHTIRSRKTKTLLVLQPTDCLVCDSTSVSRTFQRLFYRIHMKPRTSITQTHVYIIYIARN